MDLSDALKRKKLFEDFDLSDILRSLGTGGRRAAAEVVGLPGDIRMIANRAYEPAFEFVENTLGIPGSAERSAGARQAQAVVPSILPQADVVEAELNEYLGQPYVPQTDYGLLAEKIARQAPRLLSLGFGGARSVPLAAKGVR